MMQRLVCVSSTFTLWATFVSSAQGQVVPDRTTNTSVIDNCQASCNITGGIVAGENLFHSFDTFNVAPDASVYFSDPGVGNIFSRVTGENPSNILGTVGVNGGDADLFLLNPNGIIFGENAALDLNGSFLATTAESAV
ncbi:MAG: filamentous hemagglutinin N-terminal domain-containing protein, partial [Cyanobacteria bacterium J06600_6]